MAAAANGAECLLAVASLRPDLIVLDISMPVMDGFQVLRVLREKPETERVPVIMLTARTEDADVAQGWRAGADLYLTKPFEVQELVVAALRLLGEDDPDAELGETQPGCQ